jgi:hypothetical protein
MNNNTDQRSSNTDNKTNQPLFTFACLLYKKFAYAFFLKEFAPVLLYLLLLLRNLQDYAEFVIGGHYYFYSLVHRLN